MWRKPARRDISQRLLPRGHAEVSDTDHMRVFPLCSRPQTLLDAVGMSRTCRHCSLMGQGQQLGSEGDVVGCLRSLRAHAALDGVSWVRSGLVAIAVGLLIK